jgi:hypothetical protein
MLGYTMLLRFKPGYGCDSIAYLLGFHVLTYTAIHAGATLKAICMDDFKRAADDEERKTVGDMERMVQNWFL